MIEQERSPFVVRFATASHTGLVREHNEDKLVALPEHGVYVVADGMGGHAAGRVASDLCISAIEEFFAGQAERDIEVRARDEAGELQLNRETIDFAQSILLANRRIHEAAHADAAFAGMGTTVVGLRFFENIVAVAHAGDSRAYLLRGNDLDQLTEDHSLSNFLHALGREAEAQLAEATMSNVIMRALGLEAEVAVDTQELEVEPGDRFLLCSDGLSDLVPYEDIKGLLDDHTLSREEIVESLLQRSLAAGGRDNISILLVDVLPRGLSEDTADIPPETATSAATVQMQAIPARPRGED